MKLLSHKTELSAQARRQLRHLTRTAQAQTEEKASFRFFTSRTIKAKEVMDNISGFHRSIPALLILYM